MTTRNLEIFDLLPFTPRMRGKSGAWMSIVPVLLVGSILVVTAVEHTFGSVADLRQVVYDIYRGGGSLAQVKPESAVRQDFPLLRDIASWLLGGTIIAGCFVLQVMWNRISTALSELTRVGVVRPATALRLNWASRLLLIDRKLRTGGRGSPLCAPEEALGTFVGRVNASIRRWRWLSLLGILAAGGLFAWGLVTAQRHGFYVIIAPEHLTRPEQRAWAERAYEGWWAGDRHPIGHWLYVGFAVFAMSLILTFTVVGVITVYACIGLYFLAHTSADWANRDGRWGWLPVARVYATVYLALAVQGIAMSVVVLLVKLYDLTVQLEYVAAMIWMVIQYVFMFPVYLALPRLVFQRVQRSAQRERIADIDALIARVDPVKDIDQVAPIVAEIERCWAARIRPMSLRPGQWSPFVAVVLLPIVLTVSQIILS